MDSTSLKASVVVVTAGDRTALARCLASLCGESQVNLGYEVIVSDDSGDDTFAGWLTSEFTTCRFVRGPRRGPAANRNCGAREAKSEFIVFIDDDTIPDRRLIEAYLVAALKFPDCAVFEGRVFVDTERTSLAEFSPINENGGFMWSANMAIRKSLFLFLGGFNERFPFAAMEDVELRYRIRAAGHEIRFVRDAAVCHPWRKRRGGKELYQHRYSTMIYLSEHPEERSVITSIYYLRLIAYGIKDTLVPWLLRGRVRGVGSLMLEYVSHLTMALRLLFGSRSS